MIKYTKNSKKIKLQKDTAIQFGSVVQYNNLNKYKIDRGQIKKYKCL